LDLCVPGETATAIDAGIDRDTPPTIAREIGNLLPNNQRQRHTF
jgi:hypothetical protein